MTDGVLTGKALLLAQENLLIAALRWRLPLFDHLVGGHLHDQWHREAERLGRPETRRHAMPASGPTWAQAVSPAWGLSPSAPRGAKNGNFRTGDWTTEAIEERNWLRSLVQSFAKPARIK
jgi:hypothetical protein